LSTPLRRHVTVCGPKSQERGEPPGHSKPNHRPCHPWGAEGRRRSLREAKSNGVGRGGKGRLGPTLDQKRFRPRRWPLSKVSKAVSELTMPCHCLPLPATATATSTHQASIWNILLAAVDVIAVAGALQLMRSRTSLRHGHGPRALTTHTRHTVADR
jgi:hypothetical protein